jgi:hypothetical protein
MQSLILVECGSQLIPVFSDIFKFFCSTYLEVLGHTKGCLQYEVPIHYRSSVQMNAVCGLKFVECAIPGEKADRDAN